MFSAIFSSLSSLLLAGVFCYVIFAADGLRGRPVLQKALLGLNFGLLAVVIVMNAQVLVTLPPPIDAKAGPLLVAGYIGGPVGGIIAGAIGAVFHLLTGGSNTVAEAISMVCCALAGVAAHYIAPPKSWSKVGCRAVGILVVALVVGHFATNWIAGLLRMPPGAVPAFGTDSLLSLATGVVSVVLTARIVGAASNFAHQTTTTARLKRRLNLALSHSRTGMFEHIEGDDTLIVDASLARIYGYSEGAGEIPLSWWLSRIHPDDLNRVKSALRQSLEGQVESIQAVFRVYAKDGACRNINAQWVTEWCDEGQGNSIVGFQSDITDLIETQEERTKTSELLEMISQTLPGVILQAKLVKDEPPEVRFIGPRCAEIWGYSADELQSDPLIFGRQHDPDDLQHFMDAMADSVRELKPFSRRYWINHRDGTRRWLDFHGGTPLRRGKAAYLDAIVLDVTSEMKAREAAEREREISHRAQKSESIGQLTGGVAHDFNNLLAIILGNLELLREDSESSGKTELIDAAIGATMRGSELTKNLLAFARRARLKPEILNLNELVKDAQNWIGRTMPENIDVQTSLLPRLWPVKIDLSSMESALLNLILNARDAMEGHGEIEIITENCTVTSPLSDATGAVLSPGQYVKLSVADTGPGIDPSVLEEIFEPFFTTKSTGSNSGIGLSMVHGFAQQSGGQILVETEPGKGTVFSLFFPRAEAIMHQKTEPTLARPKTRGAGQRILLVEDEPEVRRTLKLLLEGQGYSVAVAPSGDAAFAEYGSSSDIGLLLTDVVMPGDLQGPGLIRKLRAHNPGLPAILITGYSDAATLTGEGLRPEDQRLSKPVRQNKLLDAVARALAMENV